MTTRKSPIIRQDPVNGISMRYSNVNQAYLIMWFDQVLRVIPNKSEAMAEYDRIVLTK